MESSPHIKLLVTSLERLNLLSEWVFEIQGLPVPRNDQPEQLGDNSSVALFLQSARRLQAGLTFEPAELGWVIRICQIMEGMPLGIELAAAWAGLLSIEEIAKECERNLDFLTVSMRDLPERHRSLRAVINHSWSLLSPDEKIILSRLSVFRSTFSRQAAEKVCSASLPVLSSLRDKSLLRRSDRERYGLHELIHQYAALKLAENPIEEKQAKDGHALFYAQRLAEWEIALKSSSQVDALIEMALEIDDLRQAWLWMVACCDLAGRKNCLFDLSLFQSSLFSLSLFYEMRCRNLEAINLFGELVKSLKAARDTTACAGDNQHFETVLGHLTAHLGLHHAYILRNQQACELLEEALILLENDQAKLEKAQAQITLAWIWLVQGQVRKSIVLMEQAISAFHEQGDEWWYINSITQLAWAYLSIGKIQESEALYQEGFRLVKTGDLRLGLPIRNGLARVSYLQKNYPGAEQLLIENLELSIQLQSKRQTAQCHLDLGLVALATAHIEPAELHFQECVNLLSGLGESGDLAIGLIYSGKCLVARQELEAAHRKFLHAIQIGQAQNIFYLIFWGLVNISRVYLEESQTEKALEIALVLQKYSVEMKVVQDDNLSLMAELQARYSPQHINIVRDRTNYELIEFVLAELAGRQ